MAPASEWLTSCHSAFEYALCLDVDGGAAAQFRSIALCLRLSCARSVLLVACDSVLHRLQGPAVLLWLPQSSAMPGHCV